MSDSHNGLNQIAQTGSATVSHDGRGNTAAIGTASYGYDRENMLTSASGMTLSYDPALRLYETMAGGTATRFLHDGVSIS